jgi:uncharacterized membrane protein
VRRGADAVRYGLQGLIIIIIIIVVIIIIIIIIIIMPSACHVRTPIGYVQHCPGPPKALPHVHTFYM